jgi:hypothetical protein
MIRDLIITFCLLSLGTGCIWRQNSSGREGGLLVVADHSDRELVVPSIDRTFGAVIKTPQAEPLFKSSYIDADRLSTNSRAPVILICARLDGAGVTSRFVRSMLSEEAMDRTNRGEFNAFIRRDPWCSDQLLLILLGRDSEELKRNAELQMERLSSLAWQFEIDRIRRGEAQKSLNHAAQRDIALKDDLKIVLPGRFEIVEVHDSLQYLEIERPDPDCSLLIAWRRGETGDSLSPGFLYSWRKLVCASLFKPVDSFDDQWSCESSSIDAVPALKIRGLWHTGESGIGGPFLSYGFWSDKTGRYYLIDAAVRSSSPDKMQKLWQLDAIANSISIIDKVQ